MKVRDRRKVIGGRERNRGNKGPRTGKVKEEGRESNSTARKNSNPSCPHCSFRHGTKLDPLSVS